jgi:adenosylcobyric acid synthase
VAPFKAQNMALNSAVTDEGAEIGRAQWLQAVAARVRPQARMNPVLLKPVRGQGSQLVLMGQAQGVFSTQAYFKRWPRVAAVAQEAWASLAAEHEALVLEGAGSPAEVNLAHRDLANLETARFSRAPFILVADIERGGSFAQILGTLQLLPAWLRRRCLGVVFNKFRGDARLLDPGLVWLRRRGIKVLGVLPWMHGLALDEEDSLGLDSGDGRSGDKKALKIQAVRHRFTANFNDFLALAQLPGVDFQWVEPGETRAQPDLLILPGSRDSLADLEVLKSSGEAERLRRWYSQGTWVLGICGGLQMLGLSLQDPAGVDSGRRASRQTGLGLLDLATVMGRTKVLAQRQAGAQTPWGPMEIHGYEIHHGRTQAAQSLSIHAGTRSAPLLLSRGRVWASYLHGLFDHGVFRDAFLSAVARSRRKAWRGGQQSLDRAREQSLRAWSAHVAKHLDLRFLPSKRRRRA